MKITLNSVFAHLGVEIVKSTPKAISLIKGFLAIPRACPPLPKKGSFDFVDCFWIELYNIQ